MDLRNSSSQPEANINMASNFNTIKDEDVAGAARLKRTLLTMLLDIGLLGAIVLGAREAHAQGTAPTITSANATTVSENRTAAIDVNATDDSDSEGSGLTFGLSGGADQALFNVNAATGVVTFKTRPDYERPADQGTDNKYNIQVAVTDSSNLTSTQDVEITIIDLACSASSLTAPTEAVFNAALDCYKEVSAGSFKIDVTGSFTLTTSPFDVGNQDGVALTINGAGQYTPITVSAGTVTQPPGDHGPGARHCLPSHRCPSDQESRV